MLNTARVEYFTPSKELKGFVPLFTTVSYGTGSVPPTGSGVPKGPIPNSTYDQLWSVQNPGASTSHVAKSGGSASDAKEEIWRDLMIAFKRKMGIDISTVANSY